MKPLSILALIAQCLVIGSFARPQKPFDYFMFTREWPGTFCSNTHCKYHPKNTTVFTIHGLWPQYNDNHWPQFCNPSHKFDPEQVEDLIDEMDDEWPSYIMGPFWKHEWEKHGTCCEDVLSSQHAYFKAALDLHRKYDLEDALAAAGITPSSTREYTVEEIHAAFKAGLGVIPQVECEHGELNEVRMCVTRRMGIFDCPLKTISCPAKVLLPPFPSKRDDEDKDNEDGPGRPGHDDDEKHDHPDNDHDHDHDHHDNPHHHDRDHPFPHPHHHHDRDQDHDHHWTHPHHHGRDHDHDHDHHWPHPHHHDRDHPHPHPGPHDHHHPAYHSASGENHPTAIVKRVLREGPSGPTEVAATALVALVLVMLVGAAAAAAFIRPAVNLAGEQGVVQAAQYVRIPTNEDVEGQFKNPVTATATP